MKSESNKAYIKAGLTGLAVVAGGILLYFLIDRSAQVSAFIQRIGRILMPFVYGAVLAYILAPLCGKLEAWLSKHFPRGNPSLWRGLSIFISLLLALIVIALVIGIIVPNVVRSVISVVDQLPEMAASVQEKISALQVSDPDAYAWLTNFFGQAKGAIESWASTSVMPVMQQVVSGTMSVVTVLKDMMLGFIITIYLLFSRQKFAAQAQLVLRSLFSPRWADRIENEVRYADRMFNGFFMGKLLDSAIVGLLCFVGCLLLRLPYAPLISVIVGVTNIIPFFGPFIGAIPCALLLLIENPVHCLIFLAFIIVLQQLDGNVIGPRILGDKTGLSGFWVTFAILLFGGLWGIVGMVVAIPLFAVIYDVIRRLVWRGARKRGQAKLIDHYNKCFHETTK